MMPTSTLRLLLLLPKITCFTQQHKALLRRLGDTFRSCDLLAQPNGRTGARHRFCDDPHTSRRESLNSTGPVAQLRRNVVDRIKTILCVGLVILGLMLTLPWWGLIGWVAVQLVRYL